MYGMDAARAAAQERGLEPGFGEFGGRNDAVQQRDNEDRGQFLDRVSSTPAPAPQPYVDPFSANFQKFDPSTMEASVQAAQAPYRFTQKIADMMPISMAAQGIGAFGKAAFGDPDVTRARILALGTMDETTTDPESGIMSVDLGTGTIDMNTIGNFTFSGMGYPSLEAMEESVGTGLMGLLGDKAKLAVETRFGPGATGRGEGSPVGQPPAAAPATVAEQVVEDPRFKLQSGANYFTQMFGIDPKYLNYGLMPSELLSGTVPS